MLYWILIFYWVRAKDIIFDIAILLFIFSIFLVHTVSSKENRKYIHEVYEVLSDISYYQAIRFHKMHHWKAFCKPKIFSDVNLGEFYWTEFEVELILAWNAGVVHKTRKSVVYRCKQSEDYVYEH